MEQKASCASLKSRSEMVVGGESSVQLAEITVLQEEVSRTGVDLCTFEEITPRLLFN